MNSNWISPRFFYCVLALAAAFVSLGCGYPLGLLLEGTENASESASTEDQDAPKGKAEDLVKDWAKPDFMLMFSGRQHGYIEPCGCITLARQKGGLMRRHTVQKILEDRGWDPIMVDAGNQVRRFGQQPIIKLKRTYEALCKKMDYDVIGLGPDDLKLDAVDVGQTIINIADPKDNPFTCANVEVLYTELTQKFSIIEKNGKRIGITMIVGDEHLKDITKDLVTTKPMADGLKDVIPILNGEKCDMKVLVAFTSLANCRKLAADFPHFDVLVTAGGAGDPTLEPEVIQTGTHTTSMIQVGVKGMYVGLVGYYENGGSPEIKYKRVELDHRYTDSPEIKGIFKSYQEELETLWKTGNLQDIRPRLHPSGHTFVGSGACADCHDEEYDIWENGVDGEGGPHEKATRDLEKNPNDDRVWVQRHFDPECISCHATGWNPQNFYPYKSGFMDFAKDTHLHANGCENCHGPGSAHVEMEKQADRGAVDENKLMALRKEMVITLAEARANACKECHDLDNSPDFLKEGGFDEYWPKIAHGKNAE